MSNNLDNESANILKYENKNFAHQFFLQRFLNSVFNEIKCMQPDSILDFGCGEGLFLRSMLNRGLDAQNVLGIDISSACIEKAKKMVPEYDFREISLFSLKPVVASFDLVIAIEVLEHLDKPHEYVHQLCKLSSGYVLLTVPYEPFFRMANFFRGRNIASWGNHPEHLNNWTPYSFRLLLKDNLNILKLYVSFPWIICIGEPG